jgi:hypothetical protein
MLFPRLRGLRILRVEDTGEAVAIRACCRAACARCPSCGVVSARIHGAYARVVADGAAGGRPVLIILAVRRFRCPDRPCAKATFAEQAEDLSVRYRRRSVPLLGMLAAFGLELGGRAGSRLAGFTTSGYYPGRDQRVHLSGQAVLLPDRHELGGPVLQQGDAQSGRPPATYDLGRAGRGRQEADQAAGLRDGLRRHRRRAVDLPARAVLLEQRSQPDQRGPAVVRVGPAVVGQHGQGRFGLQVRAELGPGPRPHPAVHSGARRDDGQRAVDLP